MVRRVGYETEKPSAKKSIADSYLDEFRARAARQEQQTRQKKPPRRYRNWLLILFLGLWLVFWSIGILTVCGVIASGGAPPFLFAWLAFALLGWVVVFSILRRQIRGTPVDD